MLLRRLYKRIVLLLRLAHGIFQITLLKRWKEKKEKNIKPIFYTRSIFFLSLFTHVMVLLIVIRDMPIDRRRPDRSDPQLALLGHRLPRVRYPADQIAVGRVRQA